MVLIYPTHAKLVISEREYNKLHVIYKIHYEFNQKQLREFVRDYNCYRLLYKIFLTSEKSKSHSKLNEAKLLIEGFEYGNKLMNYIFLEEEGILNDI